MAKRFTDTGLWEKDWFMNLTPEEKCALYYVKDRCDPVGVWKLNTKLADFVIGKAVNWEEMPSKCNGNIEVLPDGKWWIVDFCQYQYGDLSVQCRPHQTYIKLLEGHGLIDRVSVLSDPVPSKHKHDKSVYPYDRVSGKSERVSENPERVSENSHTHKEKEKEKEKELEEEKEEDCTEPNTEIPSRVFTFEWYKMYGKRTTRLIEPRGEDYARAAELLKRVDLPTAMEAINIYFDPGNQQFPQFQNGKWQYNFGSFCSNIEAIIAQTVRASPVKQEKSYMDAW